MGLARREAVQPRGTALRIHLDVLATASATTDEPVLATEMSL